MAVYLGTFGRITLRRKSNQGALESIVNPTDVNALRKRFSFDFDPAFLITGDQIDITSTNGAILDFVDTTGWADQIKHANGKWFVNVDDLGGIRLFSTFADSVNGDSSKAIALNAIIADVPIRVQIANIQSNILGNILSYELNTQRESVDITALSDQFRSQWSSLMSGSGRIVCQWDYKSSFATGMPEYPQYLLQLALRTEVGSEFDAQFFLKTSSYNPSGISTQADDQIWYEVSGVLTASAVQFMPSTIVEMTADFITTGPVRLKVQTISENKILQEDGDGILLDQDSVGSLLQEADG